MIASAACFAPSRTSIQWRRTVPVHHARIVPPAPMPGLSHRVRWALRPSEQSAHRTSCRREERGTAEESNRLIADHLNRRTRPDGASRPQRIALPSQGGIQWASNAACEPSRSPQDAFSGLGDSPYLHPADSAVPAIHSLAVRGRPVCRTSTDLTARRLLVWHPRLESNQRVRLRRSPPYPLGHGGIRFVSSGRVYGPPGSGHPRRA